MTLGPTRQYFSARTGRSNAAPSLTFEAAASLIAAAIKHFHSREYFVEFEGYWCVDLEDVPGTAGHDIENYVMFHLGREGLWPFTERWPEYSEDDLFDIIEFLHDHISKPVDGTYHSYNACGMHWEKFDKPTAMAEYREALNRILERYGPGYHINDSGEIIECAPAGLSQLLETEPLTDDAKVAERIKSAVDRYRRYGASLDDRQKAVRDLADVLEWLRPQIKTTLLKKDEDHLFKIANEFGIRHFNQRQKLDYDPAVWLSWMFYHYLATIHASLHLIKRQEQKTSDAA